MKTSLKIRLNGQWNARHELCLWAVTLSGERIAALELGLLLLAADTRTWYGSQADTWEEGPVEGIRLSAIEALRYLCAPTHNPLVEVDYSSFLLTLRDAAVELKDAARMGLLVPSVAERGLGWKLADDAPEGQYPQLADSLGRMAAVAEWASFLMRPMLDGKPEKLAALTRLEHLHERWQAGHAGTPPAMMPERDLLRLAGWSTAADRYAAAFRLDDPARNDPHGNWTLTFALADQAQPSISVDCDQAGRPIGDVPADWAYEAGSAERLLSTWLIAVPFLADPDQAGELRTKLNDEEAWSFLTEISGHISDYGGAVLLPAWWNRLRHNRPRLKARLQSKAAEAAPAMFGLDQMLDFDWKLSVGDTELTEQEFRAIAEGQKPLHFIQGRWIALDPALVDQLRKVMEKAKRKRGMPLREVLLRRFGAAEGDGARSPDDEPLDWEVETDGPLMRFLGQLGRTESIPAVPVSPQFQGVLRGYQVDGLSWLAFLRQFGLGGCLADDMGLGKTIQYIAYLLHVKEHRQDGREAPSMLICPTSLVGNWQKELERFAPGLRVYLHYGSARTRDPERFHREVQGFDLVLTTYMTGLLDIAALQTVHWDSLCLDEAQNMKNAYTKQSSAIRRLTAAHRIAMTGTPVENRLSELWSILDFINPGYLGSQSAFNRHYSRLAERGAGAASEPLRRLVRPFILRRMKSDPKIAPDLPDKVESKVYVPLTKEQAALYENVLDRLFGNLGERRGIERRGSILAALTQLKQICDHPALFTKDSSVAAAAPRHSHKSQRLIEMVGELRAEGDRCLIFTQYVEMGMLLQQMIERALREPVLYLHGGTPKAQRDKMVERFQGHIPLTQNQNQDQDQTQRPGIFVLSLKAGGTGLNLTAANHVFHYDRWWNPAVENQATDRAYRIGQQRLVQVHKFISLGTLEERIDGMIEKKQNLSREIIDTSDNWVTELSTDELQDLFALRRSWIEG